MSDEQAYTAMLEEQLAAKTRECERANAGIDNANQTLREIGLRLSEKVYELLRVANAIEPDKGSLNVEELVASAIQLRVDLAAKTRECEGQRAVIDSRCRGAVCTHCLKHFAKADISEFKHHAKVCDKHPAAIALKEKTAECERLTAENAAMEDAAKPRMNNGQYWCPLCTMNGYSADTIRHDVRCPNGKADHPGRALLEREQELESALRYLLRAIQRIDAGDGLHGMVMNEAKELAAAALSKEETPPRWSVRFSKVARR